MEFSHTIGAKVSEETYKQVQQIAWERDCNPSDVVREAVCQYMKKPLRSATRTNTAAFATNPVKTNWTHSLTGHSTKDARESQRMPSLLESMQTKHLQNMQEAKSAGDAIGGLILLASVLFHCV